MKYTKFGDKIRVVVQVIRRKSKNSTKEILGDQEKNIYELYLDGSQEVGTKGDQKFQAIYNTKRIYEADKHKTKLVVSVIDSGCGIKKKKQT